MPTDFKIPGVIHELRGPGVSPFRIGYTIGAMLSKISSLLTTHLDHAVDFQNASNAALAPEFIQEVDRLIAFNRRDDGFIQPFPMDFQVERKYRKPRRRAEERYLYSLKAAYKKCIRESMADVFQAWDSEQTMSFNRGVDEALRHYQAAYYPDCNVAFEAGDRNWKDWLDMMCEEMFKRKYCERGVRRG
ncbi:hypothetical protein GQ44DRAFT_717130 [Phaeosphaeriaceae sp. PMI808]|nr:hypothetical protein GQ44DRAFT_717130 [Phaeosphaeriaceae sp. PMI808]